MNSPRPSLLTKIFAFLTIATFLLGSLPIPSVHATGTQIRQEINIIDGALTSTGTLESDARVQLDTTKYSGTVTYYFEAVIAGSTGNTGTIKLARAGTTTYDASLTGSTSSSYSLVRSAAFTPPASTQTEYTVKLIGDGTHSQTVKAARIIVIQNGNPITSTETQIEIGNKETGKTNTSAAALSAPKYWKYNAANWDAGQTFYAEATYKTNLGTNVITYSTPGSYAYTPSAGTTSVNVQLWGGGGAGGGASSRPDGGGGGAGGQYAQKTIASPTAVTVVIGGTTAGCSSGTCSVGSDSTYNGTTVVAKGGAGGTSNNGAGGVGSTTGGVGDVVHKGGSGGAGTSTYGSGGGGGAGTTADGGSVSSGVAGAGGAGNPVNGSGGPEDTSSKTNGNAGTTAGGGGGGAYRNGSGGTINGGAGAQGYGILTETLPYPVTLTLQQSDGTGNGFTGWTNVATIVSSGTATSDTRARSSSFTPVDGRNYRIVSSVGSGGNYDVYNAKIVADQSSTNFLPLGQSTQDWEGLAVDSSNHNVYATATSGDIYEQTGGTGNFVALGQGALSWSGIAVDSSNHNVYATATSGDIYEQTGGTGNFVALGQGTLGWSGIAVDPSNHNVYATVIGGDIYEQTGGTGNFVALGQTARDWVGIAIDSSNHNVYATDNTSGGDIYEQTGGTGNFVALGQAGGQWAGISIDSSNHNVYITNDNYDNIYEQVGGTGSVVSLGQVSVRWYSISVDSSNQNIYAGTLKASSTGDIYKRTGISVTKLEPQYLLANTTLAAGTSLQSFLTKWDSTEWSGVTNTYTHVVDAAASSTSVAEIDTAGGTQVTGSVVSHPDNQGPNAYNLSTASYASKSFSVGSQDTFPSGIVFNSDGTTMYIVGRNNATIYQYNLSTAYDVSTASYASKSFSVSAQESSPTGLAFSPDGTTMYIIGTSNIHIYQYSLSTAYDVSTASYASKSFSVSQTSNPEGLAFSPDGTKFFVSGNDNGSIYQYSLSTAYDVSTASYASKSLSVTTQDTAPTGIVFNNIGTKIYVVGYSNKTVYQYSIPDGIMTMPSNGNLDVKATTNNNDLYGSRIIVQVTPVSTATSAFTQSNYRFFNNTNSTDVGTALASQNTTVTLPSSNAQFRLRMLVHVTGVDLATSGQSFKLQYALMSGSCDTAFSGETYNDVTMTTPMSYYDNFVPVDGTSLTTNANDPSTGNTVVGETYVESNNFTNTAATVPVGQDGEWDFSLFDRSVGNGVSYCFRVVKSDGTPLGTYSYIPEITTAQYVSRGGGGGAAGGETSNTPNATTTGGGQGGGGGAAGGESGGTPSGSGQGGGSSGGSGDTGFLIPNYTNYFALLRNFFAKLLG